MCNTQTKDGIVESGNTGLYSQLFRLLKQGDYKYKIDVSNLMKTCLKLKSKK